MAALAENQPGALYGAAERTVTAMKEEGVHVIAGADANSTPGIPAAVSFGTSLHQELHLLAAAGLSLASALQAATRNPAEAFGLHDRGEIAVGKRADLLLVDGDLPRSLEPLSHIRHQWIAGGEVLHR